jgi:hypothetical protein
MNKMSRVMTASLPVLFSLLCPQVVLAGSCGDNDPATPVPECRNQNHGQQVPCSDPNAVRLWPAGLRPGLPGQTLPPERDSTQWTSTTIPGAFSGHELFHGLDILGNKLYVAYNAGFQIWDIASGPHAEQPSRELTKDGWRGDFLDFPSFGENDFYVDDIDAVTAGGKNLIALSGRVTVGLSVWEHTIAPLGLVQKYQDLGNRSQRVRVVNQGGINYAFAGGQLGIFVYDLNAAQALASPCLDLNGAVCPGVYRGKLGETNLSLFLDAIQRDGRVYIAKSGGNGVPIEIWEVTTPSSPGTAVRRFQGLVNGGQGLAFFEIDTIPYLGVVEKVGSAWRLRAYNVDACLDTDGCGSLGSPLIDRALSVSASTPQFLNFSSSGATPFLYYGANEFGLEGGKVEQLLDLSNFPGSVSEITDGGGTYHDTCNGETVDYWGDYYPHNDFGLRNVRPMVGKFRGSYFYRAAFGILDVHVRPDLSVGGPSQGYSDVAYIFEAVAGACEPDPVYDWDADGGLVSGTGAVVEISWPTPGLKTVTVSNSGCPAAEAEAVVDILDPVPAVGGVSFFPPTPKVCEQMLFSADDVTGQPPVVDSWEIVRSSDDLVVAAGSGSEFTFAWDSAQPVPALEGEYTARVMVANGAGSEEAESPFSLGAAQLDIVGGPTYDGAPDPAGVGATVQFRAETLGATTWIWNWGDGSPPEAFTSRQAGENPTHDFGVAGTHGVSLTIESCDPLVQPLQVQAEVEVLPLEITSFQASCLYGVCVACIGEPEPFTLTYDGQAELFSFDWDADGEFEESVAVPAGAHTYDAEHLNIFPRARVTNGIFSDDFVHSLPVTVVDCSAGPFMFVSGPVYREVDLPGAYEAFPSGCAYDLNGFTWTASDGGIVTGDIDSSRVAITWTTVGAKTVTVTNSFCQVVGERPVFVTDNLVFYDGFESGDTSAW